ncbi:MAG: DoxX family protein [Actinomycetia bacterium]|nr:DoxX family protein [Actinomycetes bacterium]
MNIVIWVLQVLLAAAFAAAGLMKLTQPRTKLTQNMGWVEDFSDSGVKGIGGVELLAAIGLILPAATKILPVLTPLAATGLVLLMIGAIVTHVRRNENQMIAPAAVLLILAAVVTWARFGPYSL